MVTQMRVSVKYWLIQDLPLQTLYIYNDVPYIYIFINDIAKDLSL